MTALRVLFVTGSYPPMMCGVGDYTASLVRALSQHTALQLAVVTSDCVTGAHDSDFNIEIIPIAHEWFFSELPNIVRAIRQWSPDIVHIQYPTLGYKKYWAPYFLPLLLRFFRINVVQTWHESPTRFRFFPNSLTRDYLIGVEPNFLEIMKQRYKYFVSRKFSTYIPIGSNIRKVNLTQEQRKEIRARFVSPDKKLVVYFGFLYPDKNVEALFDIADPVRDTLVLVSQLDMLNPYHKIIDQRMKQSDWSQNCFATGFLSAEDVAKILSVADAAIFPFKNGVGMRNGSFLAAKLQGTFAITTSNTKSGYDEESNVYFARPNDNQAMRLALSAKFEFGNDVVGKPSDEFDEWRDIGNQHFSLYRSIVDGKNYVNQ